MRIAFFEWESLHSVPVGGVAAQVVRSGNGRRAGAAWKRRRWGTAPSEQIPEQVDHRAHVELTGAVEVTGHPARDVGLVSAELEVEHRDAVGDVDLAVAVAVPTAELGAGERRARRHESRQKNQHCQSKPSIRRHNNLLV